MPKPAKSAVPRRPSVHRVVEVKRVGAALTAMTNKPITGGRFYPDGSFTLFVGEPADKTGNPWDEVFIDAANKKRSA
jgi:hypothetical protein